MTATQRVCHHCDEAIVEAEDAVYVGRELGNSGPGWDIWAHRAHVDLLGPDPVPSGILLRVLLAQAGMRN